MKTHRSFIRRFCFALVTARTLAFALAPLLDLQAPVVSAQTVAVQTAPDSDGPSVPQHDPSTCAICALLHDTPWPPVGSDAPHANVVVVGETFELASAAISAAPRQGFRSRAPPVFG